ncbi:MAG: rhodanese-related sulfurtransferase [Solimonas sp.]
MTAAVPTVSGSPIGERRYAEIRAALLARREIALLDVREEDPYAQEHPLFAVNLPLSRLELEAWDRLPRRDVEIVVYDDGEQWASVAARRLRALGYSNVHLLAGGLQGWRDAGGELFRDVNVPSKAFGELVEAERHTPSLSAAEVQALLDANGDVVVVDVRRFDEYRTMNIPGSTSVPGGELVYRIADLVTNPRTKIIVNCAGRTRSIIGTQSLVNAGIPNPVAALRNGTIGWTLARQSLEHGAQRRFGEVSAPAARDAARRARAIADRAGVLRVDAHTVDVWLQAGDRTLYCCDVRTPEEFARGHLQGFRSTPGGQLVQETDHTAAVRGARLVLVDDDGVRANMTASWLAQMNWEVYVLDGVPADAFTARGEFVPSRPEPPPTELVSTEELAQWLHDDPQTVVVDLASHAVHRKAHLPGARFAIRARLAEDLAAAPIARRYVLTSPDGLLARFAAPELQAFVNIPVLALAGGTETWRAAGRPLSDVATAPLSPLIDRYRRPYEGTDNAESAMQAYLDWEFGLVAQLARDGTHGFFVV